MKPGAPGPTAVFAISGDGTTITVSVPDGSDENAIAAVVAAHDPTPPPEPPDPDKVFYVALNSATTVTQVRTLLRTWLRVKNRLE